MLILDDNLLTFRPWRVKGDLGVEVLIQQSFCRHFNRVSSGKLASILLLGLQDIYR